MANSEWVKYTEWTKGAMTDYGAVRLDNLDRYLNASKIVAEEMFQECDADYIVYAVKLFENGELFEVKFCKALVDKEQLEEMRKVEGTEVLAVSRTESEGECE